MDRIAGIALAIGFALLGPKMPPSLAMPERKDEHRNGHRNGEPAYHSREAGWRCGKRTWSGALGSLFMEETTI